MKQLPGERFGRAVSQTDDDSQELELEKARPENQAGKRGNKVEIKHGNLACWAKIEMEFATVPAKTP